MATLGTPAFSYVADCKLATRDNMDHIAGRGGRFLTILPRTRREDAAGRAWIAGGDLEWDAIARVPGKHKADPDELYWTRMFFITTGYTATSRTAPTSSPGCLSGSTSRPRHRRATWGRPSTTSVTTPATRSVRGAVPSKAWFTRRWGPPKSWPGPVVGANSPSSGPTERTADVIVDPEALLHVRRRRGVTFTTAGGEPSLAPVQDLPARVTHERRQPALVWIIDCQPRIANRSCVGRVWPRPDVHPSLDR